MSHYTLAAGRRIDCDGEPLVILVKAQYDSEKPPISPTRLDTLARDAVAALNGVDRLAALESLVREMLAYEAEEFDGPPDMPLDVSGADLVDAFADWRERLKAVLSDAPQAPPATHIAEMEAAGWTVANSHGTEAADGSRTFYAKDAEGNCYGDYATEGEAWARAWAVHSKAGA
jgi:hypothetical protein